MRIPLLSRFIDRAVKSTITNSFQLSQYLQSGSGSNPSGVTVTAESAMRQSTVFQCIKVIAESIGQMPFNIYQKQGKNYRIATEHPLYELMHFAPNEFMTSQEMDELIVANLSLRGNSFWFKNKNARGEIVELLPLSPDNMKMELVDGWTRKYTYRDPKQGGEQIFTSDEIWHVKYFSKNGYWGMTPIQQAQNSIGLAIVTEQHGSRHFKNFAKPNGLFKVNGVMSEDQAAMQKENLNGMFSGENSGSIGLIQGDMEWVSMSMSNSDSQFLDTRKYQREDIAATWRVPPHMVGDMSSSTNNNIEHQTLSLVTHTLNPWMERKNKSARQSILTADEKKDGYFFDYVSDEFIAGDLKSRAEAFQTMILSGQRSPNEVRALRRLDPYTGGDEFVKPRSPNEPKPKDGESNENEE